MRRTARMDVNRRAKFREAPGRAGMIEMDVAEKHVPDIFGGEAGLLKLLGQADEGRLRTGVEEHESVVRFEGGGGDDAWPAELPRIENMDVHARSVG